MNNSIIDTIKEAAAKGLNQLFPDLKIPPETVAVNEVKSDFEGDFALILFPFLKVVKKRPDELGQMLGEYFQQNCDWFDGFSVVKGFLNISVKDEVLIDFLLDNYQAETYGKKEKNGQRIMVEYSSPNTNKPLHFGHLRNIFLGWSVSQILEDQGYEVVKANLVNDRGIHICKSMIAWMDYGNGDTPESTGTKGDHLVGDYYVKFNDVYKEEVATFMKTGMTEEEAKKKAPILLKAQDMLRRWEAGDKKVRELWQKMNDWVFAGFHDTYKRMGVSFDKIYVESNTYLLGKEMVELGLEKGVLFTKEDGSVWIDLTADGLDQKLLLRGDGTSVYMTQDLGTARLKFKDFNLNESIYVIGDEQNYHMKVLKLILKKLGETYADHIFHLSYGMVELPTGRMKSREGTVVDADDMIDEMIQLSKEQTEESGKIADLDDEGLAQLYSTIGLGALKFYLLRVEPKKKMIFNPKESIDLHGFTATFIQYAHARICSILRKVDSPKLPADAEKAPLEKLERDLLLQLEQFPSVLEQAAKDYNPSLVCNYAFKLAQTFNSFFDKHSVIRAESEGKKQFRLHLSEMTALVLRRSLLLLGITAPEKM